MGFVSRSNFQKQADVSRSDARVRMRRASKISSIMDVESRMNTLDWTVDRERRIPSGAFRVPYDERVKHMVQTWQALMEWKRRAVTAADDGQ